MNKIVNGVANDYEFPDLDWIHHNSKTSEPLERQIQTFTRWQDPTIEEYKKEITKLTNNWNELRKRIKEYLEECENSDDEWLDGKCDMARDILYDMEEINGSEENECFNIR